MTTVEKLLTFLIDKLPVATVMAYAAVVVVVIGYLSNDLTVFEALAGLGITQFGAGKLGEARNQAGRGVKR